MIFYQASIYAALKKKQAFINPMILQQSQHNSTSSQRMANKTTVSGSLDSHKSNVVHKVSSSKTLSVAKSDHIAALTISQEPVSAKLASTHLEAVVVMSPHSYQKSLSKNKRAFRTLLIVTLPFILLWTPWMIAWPINTYCYCIPERIYGITYWLEYLNSLINSVLLIAVNTQFRDKFVAMFKWGQRRRPCATNTVSTNSKSKRGNRRCLTAR